jgi:integrating conjugative element protein (TIGR03757 family)
MLSLLMPLLVLPALTAAEPEPVSIDVFVTSTIAVIGIEPLRERLPDSNLGIHPIDGIEQVKALLSQNLPVQAEAARRIALERMQHLNKDEHNRLRQSAASLLLARQLGVERYPAVVFDRHWVVYGVTDLRSAYALFQQRNARENW